MSEMLVQFRNYSFLFLLVALTVLLVTVFSKRLRGPNGKSKLFRRTALSKEKRLEIGETFERKIGALMEKDGWTIAYAGVEKGLEDGGIDLIGKRAGITSLVQCKCWRADKVIHEKHINQFRGAIEKYKADHPGDTIEGAFVTTARLSVEARRVSEIHGIEVVEKYRD